MVQRQGKAQGDRKTDPSLVVPFVSDVEIGVDLGSPVLCSFADIYEFLALALETVTVLGPGGTGTLQNLSLKVRGTSNSDMDSSSGVEPQVFNLLGQIVAAAAGLLRELTICGDDPRCVQLLLDQIRSKNFPYHRVGKLTVRLTEVSSTRSSPSGEDSISCRGGLLEIDKYLDRFDNRGVSVAGCLQSLADLLDRPSDPQAQGGPCRPHNIDLFPSLHSLHMHWVGKQYCQNFLAHPGASAAFLHALGKRIRTGIDVAHAVNLYRPLAQLELTDFGRALGENWLETLFGTKSALSIVNHSATVCASSSNSMQQQHRLIVFWLDGDYLGESGCETIYDAFRFRYEGRSDETPEPFGGATVENPWLFFGLENECCSPEWAVKLGVRRELKFEDFCVIM